jgi:hypothetical protein
MMMRGDWRDTPQVLNATDRAVVVERWIWSDDDYRWEAAAGLGPGEEAAVDLGCNGTFPVRALDVEGELVAAVELRIDTDRSAPDGRFRGRDPRYSRCRSSPVPDHPVPHGVTSRGES